VNRYIVIAAVLVVILLLAFFLLPMTPGEIEQPSDPPGGTQPAD
jgi:hypothetical protein